jgi:hypothetical protein
MLCTPFLSHRYKTLAHLTDALANIWQHSRARTQMGFMILFEPRVRSIASNPLMAFFAGM